MNYGISCEGSKWVSEVRLLPRLRGGSTDFGRETLQNFLNRRNALVTAPCGQRQHRPRWLLMAQSPLWTAGCPHPFETNSHLLP